MEDVGSCFSMESKRGAAARKGKIGRGGDGEMWKETSVLQFDLGFDKSSGQGVVGQPQCNCLTLLRNVGAENLALQQQVHELQAEMKILKAENARNRNAHKAELRWREKKELGIAIVVALFACLYVITALMTRGFV